MRKSHCTCNNPQDLRPENETPSQQAPTRSVSSDVAKVAFAFGQFLHPLPITKHYVSEVSKVVYQTGPEARCGKLKGLVSKCPYLSMKGGAQGGTYVIVLYVKLFNELNK